MYCLILLHLLDPLEWLSIVPLPQCYENWQWPITIVFNLSSCASSDIHINSFIIHTPEFPIASVVFTWFLSAQSISWSSSSFTISAAGTMLWYSTAIPSQCAL